jgi:hypothetical protein
MSIHPEIFEDDAIPIITLRHVKIQNFRLVPLLVFDLWDFIF